MQLIEFQDLIRKTYIHYDAKRGVNNTFLWLKSEVKELENAIKRGDIKNQKEEIADVLAWLTSIANLLNINIEEAVIGKYGRGCPKCGSIPCKCPYRERPSK